MTQITSKICVVGDFAVGKTSVIERFVSNQFSEKYLTTVGVKIDTKEISLAERGISVKLIIWDVAGAEEFGAKEFAYLRGATGFIFVVDGTREQTLISAQNLRNQIREKYGVLPAVLLLNKCDLSGMWRIDNEKIEPLRADFDEVYRTSAKTGVDVEVALSMLANLIVTQDLR
ncbi:MAG: GTP-binding protein [Gammaproteobacteria bacterium]|nr:GTP-binding protein [Gammaproteobacteria bacterium]MDH3415218.1 GTP-binding protein [Gammaproteobacteria bacterium]